MGEAVTTSPTTRPPIIVTGMHRSGTTLLVGLLSQLGASFGTRTDPNAEDLFFLRLNEWVMRRAGGAWDYPLPTVKFLGNQRFFDDVLDLLARIVRSESSTVAGERFKPPPAEVVWGWKDPRAVFTFPLWGRVFPGAKLIYIRRNGVDAASSLLTRERNRWREERNDARYLQIRPLMGRWQDLFKSMESFESYLFSTRCLTLYDAFELWEEYVAQGERLFTSYSGPKLALQYERLIADPEGQLDLVARFCDLPATASSIAGSARGINTGRAHAFLADETLCRFYGEVKDSPWMRALGYDAIPATSTTPEQPEAPAAGL